MQPKPFNHQTWQANYHKGIHYDVKAGSPDQTVLFAHEDAYRAQEGMYASNVHLSLLIKIFDSLPKLKSVYLIHDTDGIARVADFPYSMYHPEIRTSLNNKIELLSGRSMSLEEKNVTVQTLTQDLLQFESQMMLKPTASHVKMLFEVIYEALKRCSARVEHLQHKPEEPVPGNPVVDKFIRTPLKDDSVDGIDKSSTSGEATGLQSEDGDVAGTAKSNLG